MGLFKSIKNAIKKTIKFSTGGLVGGNSNYGQATENTVPAPELGFVDTDISNKTESESEKQQLFKGKKRGKKSLKVNMAGSGGAGRNIV